MNNSFYLILDDSLSVHKTRDQHVAIVDCCNCVDSASFYKELAVQFKLNDDFGNNLDALYDSLSDLEWIKKPSVVLIIKNFDDWNISDSDESFIDDFLILLSDVMIFWEEENTDFSPKKFSVCLASSFEISTKLNELEINYAIKQSIS